MNTGGIGKKPPPGEESRLPGGRRPGPAPGRARAAWNALWVPLLLIGCGRLDGQADKPPYVSAVPRYTFARTLGEQEEELKTNPLIRSFARSRTRRAADRHLPLYHFTSPDGEMNDPNGLCFWGGNWHLFYQAYPPEDKRQHWGHAISTDLIHWRDLPYAIYPGPEQKVYSGSTLVEEGRVIAMYHGTQVGNMVAVSDDPLLLNWSKVTGKAVIPISGPGGAPLPYFAYDPCIWKKAGVYYSISGGRLPAGPGGKPVASSSVFRSKDLATWEYLHEFVQGDRFTLVNDDYAVPYFWPIGGRYILSFASHMSGAQYLLGDYEKESDRFVVTGGGRFNFGAGSAPELNAPSTTPDGKGGIIMIVNLVPGKPGRELEQAMTLPRRLTLAGSDGLGFEPAGDVESLRHDRQELGPMVLPANREILLDGVQGSAMEIDLEIDPKNASEVELNVLRSPDGEEFTRIAFFREGGFNGGRDYRLKTVVPVEPGVFRMSLIGIDPSNSSLDPNVRLRAPQMAPILFRANEFLKLRVFIDQSVVEVFANGRQALAVMVFPSRNDSTGVSLRSHGQDAGLRSLEAWQMKEIRPSN